MKCSHYNWIVVFFSPGVMSSFKLGQFYTAPHISTHLLSLFLSRNSWDRANNWIQRNDYSNELANSKCYRINWIHMWFTVYKSRRYSMECLKNFKEEFMTISIPVLSFRWNNQSTDNFPPEGKDVRFSLSMASRYSKPLHITLGKLIRNNFANDIEYTSIKQNEKRS